ncbi:MAG: tetratricopeptide repeat protein [Verrucomicrobiota bacterium]|nr:tetratricopeptide repeat protein [Verrucomicrobiota bacterium]
MNRGWILLMAVAGGLVWFPFRSPAPLIYTPGEGWYYVPFGQSRLWQRDRAKDQLAAAQQAFDHNNIKIALLAAHRLVRLWPLSDYAPDAQYLIGRCLELDGRDQAAFKAYQVIVEKYPRSSHYEEVLWRQYEIAGRFLNGEWFRLWNYIPFFPSMDRTAKMYAQIVKSGPYSDVAPHAQLRIGAAREKQKDYPEAVKAYALAADRYHDQPVIAADALYREAVSYEKQAETAEYDQGTAKQAIDTYTDFLTLFPNDPRAPTSQKAIAALQAQQVEGNFAIARFYEKSKKWAGAVVYYNAVLQINPNSPYAARARQRIAALKPRVEKAFTD